MLAFTGQLTIGWLAGLALFHGVVHAFSVPAAFGLLPRFVAPARLASAIAVSSAYTQLGIFIGPALAGWVLLHYGPATAFASNVFGYGVFFVSAARLRAPPGEASRKLPQRSFREDFVEGLVAIRAHAGVSELLMLMLFGDSLAAAVRQMLPALSDRNLGAGIGGLSTLLASAGIGATMAALWIAYGGRKRLHSGLVLDGVCRPSRGDGSAGVRQRAAAGRARHGRARRLPGILPHRRGGPSADLDARRAARPHHERAIPDPAGRQRDRRRRRSASSPTVSA